MNLSLINNNRIICSFCFLIIILGFYLCFIGGYGSDEDTLPLIYVFEQRCKCWKICFFKIYRISGTEIGIGFLSYYFGSWAANSVTYLFLILGIFFFSSFKKSKIKKSKYIYFFTFYVSNPVLF